MTDQPIRVGDELFLGRLDEQERFRDVLHTVLTRRDDDDASPFIFLIYGEGGMGKSQLTRRLHDIATTEPPFERAVQALRLDWELIRNDTPALRIARHQIHPETVLDAFHRAALDRDWGHHFKPYQQAIDRRKQAEQDVAKALDREREQSRYTALRDLGATGLAKLVRMSLPVIGQTGEEFSRALLSAGIQLGAEQAATAREQAEQFLKARLKPDLYDIYRQPHQQLARALGQGLRRIAHDRPLVLSLDTYEIIAEAADISIRQVIKAAGPRVVWLIAGRDNLAASRPGDRYVGYSADFTRNLIIWDIQELAIEYVTTYLLDRASDRPPTPDEAAAIHRVTLGVPLALRQVADLWGQGIELTAITEGIPDYTPREELIRLMCERVLIHVEQDTTGQADRRALYTLAMQPRPDPEIQAAILRSDDSPFDLNARLADLARHYSVVRLPGGARLHQAMGGFVSEYLMRIEAPTSDLIKDIATQAVETLQRRRANIETNYPTLEERVDSEDWRQTTLDLLHWLFWQDEQTALHELIPRLVEGLGYDQEFSQSLLDVASAFTPLLSRDGQRLLKRLNLTPENRDICLTELDKLAQRRWLEAGYATHIAERQAILLLWRGLWLADKEQFNAAYQTYQKAEHHLPTESAHLRTQLGRAFDELSRKLLWSGGAKYAVSSELGLQASQRATILNQENHQAWYRLGTASALLGRHEKAIEAFQQAIHLDPNFAFPHNGLGNIYRDLGRHKEAIQAYQQAIHLDPNFAVPHNGLGIVYSDLDRHDEAIEAFQQAIHLDPKFVYPYNGLGIVYRDLGRHKEAIEAFQQAIHLDPKFVYPYNGLGIVYRILGRHTEAIEAFQQATHLDPNFVSPHNNLGIVYHDLGRHKEAIETFQQAIHLDPNYAYPHNGLGIVYRDLGRHKEAIEAFQQAIHLDPNLAVSHNNLGNVYRILNRYEEAIQSYQQAIDLNPEDADFRVGLAAALHKSGQKEEAEKQLEQARALMPPADESPYSWACLEAVTGHTEAALDYLAKALAQKPTQRTWAKRDSDLESLRGHPRFEQLVGGGEGE